MELPGKLIASQKSAFLTLTFDGGYKETMELILPILEKEKISATFFIVTGSIGKTLEGRPVVDASTIQNIERTGHEIASHSVTHVHLSTPIASELSRRTKEVFFRYSWKEMLKKVSIERILRIYTDMKLHRQSSVNEKTFLQEASQSKTDLNNLLLQPVVSFAYPGGWSSKSIIKDLKKIGYHIGRTTESGTNTFPIQNPLLLKSIYWRYNSNSSDMNHWVDASIAEKGWLIETFHAISETGGSEHDPYTISLKQFSEHLAYIRSRSDSLTIDTLRTIFFA